MIIKKLVGMLVVLSLSAVCVGCGDDDDDDVDVSASCQKFCNKVAPLNCAGTPAATCVADCEENAGVLGGIPAKCQDQVNAAARCIDALDTSDYECDEFENEATLKNGVCQTEQLAVLACVAQG